MHIEIFRWFLPHVHRFFFEHRKLFVVLALLSIRVNLIVIVANHIVVSARFHKAHPAVNLTLVCIPLFVYVTQVITIGDLRLFKAHHLHQNLRPELCVVTFFSVLKSVPLRLIQRCIIFTRHSSPYNLIFNQLAFKIKWVNVVCLGKFSDGWHLFVSPVGKLAGYFRFSCQINHEIIVSKVAFNAFPIIVFNAGSVKTAQLADTRSPKE